MQEQLEKALEFSNYRQTLTIRRKTLKEKIEGQLTYGYNGGIFKINRGLLTFVEILNSKGRKTAILLDVNDNPILIEDLEGFKDEIFDRYFTSTNEYYEEYQSLKKSRSVEKLIQ